MKIIHGNCGHKVRWDNHLNCFSCSSCSRLSTCSTCSNWSENTWILADKRRIYSSRKSVMTKKRHNKQKKQIVISDLSDDNSVDGNTTPWGYTARGRAHPGGIFMGAIGTQKSLSPPVTSQPVISQPVTGQPVTGQPVWSTSHRARFHTGAGEPGTGNLIPGIRHQSPVIGK